MTAIRVETAAQTAGVNLPDPTAASAQDPYSLQNYRPYPGSASPYATTQSPYGQSPYGTGASPYGMGASPYGGQAPYGTMQAGLIDQPIFDGHILDGMLAYPRSLFQAQTPYRGRLFFRGDYLGWWMDPMQTPVLVTTNPAGTPQNQAGFIGGFKTEPLFGGEINGDFRSGVRFRGGWYTDPSRFWAIGGDYYELFEDGDSFTAGSSDYQILARPYYDIVAGRESAQLVSYPSVVRGSVSVDSSTHLRSFGINIQADAINPQNHPSQIANGCAREPRMDFIVGYRNVQLDDSLSIFEDLEALVPPGGDIEVRDSFKTENSFSGIELGFVREIPMGRWWFETNSRLALGTNSQTVIIDGSTDLVEAGVPETFEGGLLAQRTNIGGHSRSEFCVVPELGVTLGFHVTPRFSINGGYSFVYISNVVRAGDQIDTDVNPGLLPVEQDPLSGALRPRFMFRQTDFFAHGFTAGADFRF